MCIPCVMCGACMEKGDGDPPEANCPECGAAVAPDAVSCPQCFAFLPRNAAARAHGAQKPATPTD